MKCQCPDRGNTHAPHGCPNRAYYSVTRDIYRENMMTGIQSCERVYLGVCPECKFPEDFDVTVIPDREPFQLELPFTMTLTEFLGMVVNDCIN